MKTRKPTTPYLIIQLVVCASLFPLTAHSGEPVTASGCAGRSACFDLLEDGRLVNQRVGAVAVGRVEFSTISHVITDGEGERVSGDLAIEADLVAFYCEVNLDDDSAGETVAVTIASQCTISLAVFDDNGQYYPGRWPRSIVVGRAGVCCLMRQNLSPVFVTDVTNDGSPEILLQLGNVFILFDRSGEYRSALTFLVPSELVVGTAPGSSTPILESNAAPPDAIPNPEDAD